MTDQTEIRERMIAACRRMNAAGLNIGSAGNLSVRIDKGFLVTPSGIAYDAMTADQIVTMDFAGRYYGDFVPTSEWRFHHAILKARPDGNVVLHCHAPYCSVLACCRLDIPPIHYMIAATGGDIVKCSGYAPFGTPELSEMALEALGPRNACLLGNHGVITLGKTIEGAFGLLEEVENLARIYTVVRTMGGGVILGEAEMKVVLERFKTYGKQVLSDEDRKLANRVEPPPRGGDRLEEKPE
jgi:L-fuculose-phosphate aldolase